MEPVAVVRVMSTPGRWWCRGIGPGVDSRVVAVLLPVAEDALPDLGGPAVFEAALDGPAAFRGQVGEQAVVDDLARHEGVRLFRAQVDGELVADLVGEVELSPFRVG